MIEVRLNVVETVEWSGAPGHAKLVGALKLMAFQTEVPVEVRDVNGEFLCHIMPVEIRWSE